MAVLAGITGIIPLDEAGQVERVTLGATLAPFTIGYRDIAAEAKLKGALNTSAAAARAAYLLLTGGDDGDLAYAIKSGPVELVGVTGLVVGRTFVVGNAAGQVKNESDLVATEWVTDVGKGVAAGVLWLNFHAWEIQHG